MSNELSVRYVDLPDMTVASALGFGKEPEDEAARLLNAFTRKLGFTPGSEGHPLYGFNNPNPSSGSENYGYELWCKVDADTKPDPPVEIKQVPGAQYAVTRFTGLSNIGRVWKQFGAWVEDHHSGVPPCTIQCWLEALQTPEESDPEKWVMDLYTSSLEKPANRRSLHQTHEARGRGTVSSSASLLSVRNRSSRWPFCRLRLHKREQQEGG